MHLKAIISCTLHNFNLASKWDILGIIKGWIGLAVAYKLCTLHTSVCGTGHYVNVVCYTIHTVYACIILCNTKIFKQGNCRFWSFYLTDSIQISRYQCICLPCRLWNFACRSCCDQYEAPTSVSWGVVRLVEHPSQEIHAIYPVKYEVVMCTLVWKRLTHNRHNLIAECNFVAYYSAHVHINYTHIHVLHYWHIQQ